MTMNESISIRLAEIINPKDDECYNNCIYRCIYNYLGCRGKNSILRAIRYVEGYSVFNSLVSEDEVRPIRHAWLLCKTNIIDPTFAIKLPHYWVFPNKGTKSLTGIFGSMCLITI